MSGVAKGLKKAGKSIFKGAKKVWDGSIGKVWSATSKIGEKLLGSKVFKVVAIATAVYFTGGAALGAIGGASAAGGGFMASLSGAWTGAAAGLGNAWGGITAALGGGGLGALSSGITGASAAGGAAVSGGAASLGAAFSSGVSAATSAATTAATAVPAATADSLLINAGTRTAGGQIVGAGVANAGGMAGQALTGAPGLLSPFSTSGLTQPVAVTGLPGTQLPAAAAKTGLLSNPYVQYAAAQGVTNGATGYFAAKGQEEAEEEDRQRYNENVGGYRYTSRYA